MHSESKLNSEAVRSNDRLWYYKFERSSLILDEKRLRNRSLPIDKLETENRTDLQSIFLPSEEVEEDNNESGLDLLSSLATGILQTTTTQSPTEVPTPTTMPPSTTELPTIPVRDIFNLKTKQYIELSHQLDFSLLIRPNLKFPSFPNITTHKSKSLTEGLKWHFICLYNEYTRGEDYLMTYKEKIIVMNAIIKMNRTIMDNPSPSYPFVPSRGSLKNTEKNRRLTAYLILLLVRRDMEKIVILVS